MTMIERLARAMALVDGEDYMEFHQEWDRRARAAIEAIREPTSEMLDAPAMKNWLWNDGNSVSDGELRDAWQQMIDAALQEGKETVG